MKAGRFFCEDNLSSESVDFFFFFFGVGGGGGQLLHLGIGNTMELEVTDRKIDTKRSGQSRRVKGLRRERGGDGEMARQGHRTERERESETEGGSQTALTFTLLRTTSNIQHIWLHLMWRDLIVCVCVCVFVCVYFHFRLTCRRATISMSVHASLCVSLILFTC